MPHAGAPTAHSMWGAAAAPRRNRRTTVVLTVALLVSLVVAPCAVAAKKTVRPPAPRGLMLYGASETALSIRWKATSRPVARTSARRTARYSLSLDGRSAGWTQKTTTTFRSLECGTSYTLAVRTVDNAGRRSQPSKVSAETEPCGTGGTGWTFYTVGDARVSQSSPSSNFGSSTYLRVNGGGAPAVHTYVQFSVANLAGTVERARLRFYAKSKTSNGPGAYLVGGAWGEKTITWRTRPGPSGSELDDLDAVASGTWVELDVTSALAGNGSYSFVLIGSSRDGLDMRSREGGAAPELVVSTSSEPSPPPPPPTSPPPPPPTSPPPPPSGDTTPPTEPAPLTVSPSGTTGLALTWAASTDDVGVLGYHVYLGGSRVGSTPATSYTVSGLACGTTYGLAVEAYDAAGNVSPRAVASATTGACSAPSVTCHRAASPFGSDTAAGTLEAPFRTAQKLADSLGSGQVGCLRAGTYSGGSEFVLAVEDSGLTLRGYPGERARLVGNVNVRNSAAGLRLSSLEFEGTGGSNTLKIYARDVIVEDSTITNLGRGQSCMMLGSNSGYGQALRPIIRRNRFHDCGSAANGTMDHAIYAQNVFAGLIERNTFWNSAAYAIQLYPNTQQTRFAYNVIDGDTPSVRGGVLIGGNSTHKSNDNIVEHNVVAYAKTYNITSTWNDLAPGTGNIVRKNCVWKGTLGNINTSKGGFTAVDNLVADPLFVDRAARDYRLGQDSLCRAYAG